MSVCRQRELMGNTTEVQVMSENIVRCHWAFLSGYMESLEFS